MRFILVFFLFMKILFSQDLQTLLDEYKIETSKQIAKKTKKESLGHIITFTQQDLEMMQVRVLKDILKILPKASMQTNFYGASNLTYAGNPNSISTSMRVYIDDQEVSSVESLSPWLLYADYPMEHISHIEAYYGESTLQLGNEPAKLTLKLYTKNPYTISGGILRSSISSYNSYSNTIVWANEIEDSSLIFMLNSTNIDNKTNFLKNGSVSNDSKNQYGYMAYRKDDYKISGGFAKIKKDNFLSLALDSVLDEGQSEFEQHYLEFSKKFNNELGKIYFSYSQTEKKSHEKNDEGILLASIIDFSSLNTTMPKEVNEDLSYKKYDFGISNIFEVDDYSLFLGAAVKHKSYDLKSRDIVYLDNSTQSDVRLSNLKKETIFSILSEHAYSLNDSNILIANIKYDKYKKNDDLKDFEFFTSRLGYISSINENLNLKLFLTKTFTPPSMFEIDFATKNNKDLKREDKDIATFEIGYEGEDQNISLFLNYLEIENMIVLDLTQAGYINYNEKDFNATGFSLNYEKYFNSSNKIHLNYYSYINSIKNYRSPKSGGSIKVYQKLGKFNFYEELIYKENYNYDKKLKIKDSYNLSLGLEYKISKDLQVSLKANNILDDDMDVVHTNYSDLSQFTQSNSTRTYNASLKWTF